MQRFGHRRDNRTIVPLLRALFIVVAALASVCGYSATPVPAFVVSIAGFDAPIDRNDTLRADRARPIGKHRALHVAMGQGRDRICVADT